MSRPLTLSLLALVLAILLSVAVGSVYIPPTDLGRIVLAWLRRAPLSEPLQTFAFILLAIRLPRTALMALTGAALGGSGAAYQGLFRNPLADPYLIGVASGAGLGAVLAMSLRWPYTFWGLMTVPLAAFLAALLTVFLVYTLARVGRTVPTTNLILAGVACSSFATALTSFLMLRSQGEVRRALAWLLGGASLVSWQAVLTLIPYLTLSLGALVLGGHALNLLQFGDEQAQQLGLPVERVKALVLAAASLATAAAVAFSGIIGFIGLIVPHLMRLWWGPDYRRLIPLSILGGGSALLVADVLARVVLAPQELPVGIVTALAGAPFFLWVLRRAKQYSW
ncbi:MAG: iron ABC transporter permease [Anaerolineae bacterium]|nr:MAG: iron ABC transporter permease [Anaerolineae bacterium]